MKTRLTLLSVKLKLPISSISKQTLEEMKLFIIFYVFLFYAVYGENSTFEKGVTLYNIRAKNSIGLKVDPQYINDAIANFSAISEKSKNRLESNIYLLKCYYFKGKFILQHPKEKKAMFSKGKDLGQELIKTFPNSTGAYYWYLVNLGSWAEEYGIIAAAKEGVADLMLEYSNRMIELDSDYEDGGGYFFLGAAHFKSPYIPFLLSWPNNKKAIQYLTLAYETGEKTATQTVYLAQSLAKEGQKNRAITLLENLISQQFSSYRVVEDFEQHQKAKNLLKKWVS